MQFHSCLMMGRILTPFFSVALGLRRFVRVFSRCGEQGLLFMAVLRPLIAVASLVKRRLWARALRQLWHTDPVVVARGP